MHDVRKSLGWVFAFTSLVCLSISVSLTPGMLRHHPRSMHLSLTSRLLIIGLPWLFPLFTVVFGMAWWTSFRAKSSARIWAIIASLINIQTALFPLLVPPHSFLNGFWLIFALGVLGIVAFARRTEPQAAAIETHESPLITGDSTSNLVNKIIPLVLMLAGAVG